MQIFPICITLDFIWPGRPGFNPRSSHTKDKKKKKKEKVLYATLLNTQHYKVTIKGKVKQSREMSSALPYTLMYLVTIKKGAFG